MKITPFKQSQQLKISDGEIVKKVISGEKEFYELLMRRNNQKLFRVLTSYVSNSADCADIMQETYLKAYDKLDQFKFNSSFSTWLIRIGINEALQHLRRQKKQFSIEGMRESFGTKVVYLFGAEYENPERKMIERENKQLLERAILKLKPKYRAVYMLKEVEEMSLNEVAECLEISEANAKVRLHRAKNKIRKNLFRLTANRDIFEFGNAQCDEVVEKVLPKL